MISAKYHAFLWIALINPISIYSEATDNTQCDDSACSSTFHNGIDCLVLVGDEENDPIACDSDTKFKHPSLVKLHSAYIEYTCCSLDDGSLKQYHDNQDDRQCDATACSSYDFDCIAGTDSLVFIEPIACKQENFKYPSLVYWSKEAVTNNNELQHVVYNCCKVPDGSFVDKGLPVSSLGGYFRGNNFYISTIYLLLVSAISVVLLSLLVVSILASHEARSDCFNIYLVFMAIPDWTLNMYFLITRSLFLADSKSLLFNYPVISRIIMAFSLFCNLGINAIVGYEIKKMVLRSYQHIGTNPPTITRVIVQCVALFGTEALIFLILQFLVPGNYWFLCLVGLLFLHFAAFIYLLHVLWRIRKTGILSLKGRTRSLTIYFYRILIVFIIFLIPGQWLLIMTAMNFFGAFKISARVIDIFALIYFFLTFMQGGVTATVAMAYKYEIRKSLKRIVGLESFYHFQKVRSCY